MASEQGHTAVNDGGPAFPQPVSNFDGGMYAACEKGPEYAGMSLRAWLAGQALNGLLAGISSREDVETIPYDVVAQAAEAYADATLARLTGGAR